MKPQNRFLTCRIHFRGQNFEIPKFDFLKKADGGVLKPLKGESSQTPTGKGAPVDSLDSSCKAYKNCLKCAVDTFGKTCIPDDTVYGLDQNKGKCVDNADTCSRAICECDVMFAKKHADVYEDFWGYYQTEWSTEWDKERDCVATTGGATEPKVII